MCGIFGCVTPGGPVNMPHCAAAIDALRHRGPDGIGTAVGRLTEGRLDFRPDTAIDGVDRSDIYLGHTRLAVIDLSESALQPMTNETGDVWVVFNGEIYNHSHLRRLLSTRGHVFRTDHADTEVLVHGFEEWGGAGLVDRLRGMFAFAVLNLRTAELFLARDPFGEKPLYVANDTRGIVFASELRAILKTEFLPSEISKAGLSDYLRFGYVPAPGSIISGVWKLRASETASFDLRDTRSCRRRTYWDVTDYSPATDDVKRWTSEFDQRLSAAVSDKSISDVPLGAFLSGGLDSTTVVGELVKRSPSLRTFTVGFPGQPCDETPYAQAAATRYRTTHLVADLSPASLLEYVTRAAQIFDEPFADSSALPFIQLTRSARQFVTVALSGDGGDELLAGYTRYQVNARIENWLGDMGSPLGRVARRVGAVWPHTRRGYGIARLLCGDGATRYRALLADEWLVSRSLLRDVPGIDFMECWASSAPDIMNRMCEADRKLYLPEDLMVKVDRVSMAVALEVRAPFLDRDLFEFVARAPTALRVDGRLDKATLRRNLAEDLGDRFATRRKQGFQVPLGTWFRGPLREHVFDTFSSRSALLSRFFPVDTLMSLAEDHVSGTRDQSHWIWLLLALENWHQVQVPNA